MTCPDCGYEGTDAVQCDRCGCTFVFTPKDGITDDRFLALVSEASGAGHWFFVRNQLYTAYARGFASMARAARIGVIELAIAAIPLVLATALAMGIARSVGPIAWTGTIPGLVLSVLFLGSMRRSAGFQPPGPTVVYDWLVKWERARGELARLVRRRTLEKSPEGYAVSDLLDSGIERVVIVEHAILVDLLVKNEFHATYRALIVAENGYPTHLGSALRGLLEERPALPVFLLHDSTDVGVAMAARVTNAARLPLSTRPVVDVGLTPTQVSRLSSLEGLGLKARAYGIPLDMLPYPLLVVGLVRAMQTQSSPPSTAPTAGLVTAADTFVEDGVG